jgi:hypothetical protein
VKVGCSVYSANILNRPTKGDTEKTTVQWELLPTFQHRNQRLHKTDASQQLLPYAGRVPTLVMINSMDPIPQMRSARLYSYAWS